MGYFLPSGMCLTSLDLLEKQGPLWCHMGWKPKLSHTLLEHTAAITQQDVCAIICGGLFSPDRFPVPV